MCPALHLRIASAMSLVMLIEVLALALSDVLHSCFDLKLLEKVGEMIISQRTVGQRQSQVQQSLPLTLDLTQLHHPYRFSKMTRLQATMSH